MSGPDMRMIKWKLLGSTALVAFTASTVTHAADMPARMPVKAPIAPPSFSWSGYYAGLIAGYSWRDPSIDITGNGAATATYLSTGVVPASIPVDPKGFLGGVQAGVNYQSGAAIFGFETDISYADVHDGGTAGPGAPLTNIFFCGKFCTVNTASRFNSSAVQRLDWLGTVRGRLGTPLYDRLLVFVAGGLAYGHTNLTASVLNTSGTQTINGGIPTAIAACTQVCATGSTDQWLVGWTVGAGAEYALTNSWIGKIEYLYYDLGNLSVSFSDPRFAAFVFGATASYRGNIVRAGLSFKFN